MEYIIQFFQVYLGYVKEIWFSLALGFLISGISSEFIPTHFIEKHLGGKGFKSLFIASSIGTILPVCCFGSLPIAMTLKRQGASLGAVLAFLVATPATSLTALLVVWKLLGPAFAVYIFGAVILMGLMIGFIGNQLKGPIPDQGLTVDSCCQTISPEHPDEKKLARGFTQKLKAALFYAFVTLPKEIGVELLLGIGIASFIVIFKPFQVIIKNYMAGWVGYVVVLVISLGNYVCCTASVPLVHAFIKSGMEVGQAMTYLLLGPITSYGTILAFKKAFGTRVLLIYLFFISTLSVMFGMGFEFFSTRHG